MGRRAIRRVSSQKRYGAGTDTEDRPRLAKQASPLSRSSGRATVVPRVRSLNPWSRIAFEVPTACKHRHFFACGREPAPEIPADTARADDRDLHGVALYPGLVLDATAKSA